MRDLLWGFTFTCLIRCTVPSGLNWGKEGEPLGYDFMYRRYETNLLLMVHVCEERFSLVEKFEILRFDWSNSLLDANQPIKL